MKTCLIATILLLVIGFAHARAIEKAARLCHAHANLAHHCH